jgi:8-oxo-dGTP pyrophosphatase MutT (NUDIX family)
VRGNVLAVTGARSQLLALAASSSLRDLWPLARSTPAPVTLRPAAVLILFGTTGRIPHPDGAWEVDGADPRELDVLLLHRAATLRSHADQVAFPGGRLDPGEGAITAALREAQEETGVDPSGIDILGTLATLPMPTGGHEVTPVLAWWAKPSPVAVVDEAESAAVFRAPVADLIDPENRYMWRLDADRNLARARSLSRRSLPPRDLHTGPAWRLRVDGAEHVVWGFTAGILDALLAALGWDEPWDTARELVIER